MQTADVKEGFLKIRTDYEALLWLDNEKNPSLKLLR